MKTSLVHWNVPAVKVVGQERAKTRRKIRVNWLRSLLNRIVPMGYEDAEGFHYGEPPKPMQRKDCSS